VFAESVVNFKEHHEVKIENQYNSSVMNKTLRSSLNMINKDPKMILTKSTLVGGGLHPASKMTWIKPNRIRAMFLTSI
jgi:hypothetical protein